VGDLVIDLVLDFGGDAFEALGGKADGFGLGSGEILSASGGKRDERDSGDGVHNFAKTAGGNLNESILGVWCGWRRRDCITERRRGNPNCWR
jgi:hypothetical protein